MNESSYDEVLESCAERILLVVRDNISVSGYSSDTETSLTVQESDGSSIEGTTNSLSSVSSCTSSEIEPGNLESEISFLKQKQELLQRAVTALQRGEAYNASKALETLSNKRKMKSSALWLEAKEILDILNRRESKTAPREEKNGERSVSIDARRSPNKRIKIDTSSVTHVMASDMQTNPFQPSSTPKLLPSSPDKISRPWMGHEMSQLASSSIPVANGPDSAMVLPAESFTFKDSVQLKDALRLTSEPQLLCNSTQPFRVVHCNKAFFVFSGLMPENVIGRPIQGIFHPSHEVATSLVFDLASKVDASLGDQASPKLCEMFATAVTDNSCRGISHLLFKFSAKEATCDASGACERVIDKGFQVHQHNQMFETVG